jgi:hypothetical protein
MEGNLERNFVKKERNFKLLGGIFFHNGNTAPMIIHVGK